MNAQAHDFQSKELAQKRLRQAMAMQEIEGNPLSDDQIEMFAMFDKEGWSSADQQAHIDEKLRAFKGTSPE